jgi:hypothetical protein
VQPAQCALRETKGRRYRRLLAECVPEAEMRLPLLPAGGTGGEMSVEGRCLGGVESVIETVVKLVVNCLARLHVVGFNTGVGKKFRQ